MSATIAQLLGKSQETIGSVISELEEMASYPSHDVRLVTQMQGKLRAKISELGMDPSDTTSQELHQALLNRFDHDNTQLSKLFSSTASIDKRLANVIKITKQTGSVGSVWALKNRVAKDLLKNAQPKRLMRSLNYRSLDSMLKREQAATLYAALPYVESARWLKNFEKSLSQLSASDFESKNVEISIMPAAKFEQIAKQAPFSSSLPLVGAVVLWPKSLAMELSEVALSLAVLQSAESLKAYSVYLKLQQMQPDFGQRLLKLMQNGLPEPVSFGQQSFSWPLICHYYGQKSSAKPELFDPHVQSEDFHQVEPLTALAGSNPLLSWWDQAKDVAMDRQHVASLNLMDVMQNYLGKLSNKQAAADNFCKDFWNELISRYLANPNVENRLLGQLENHLQPAEVEDFDLDDLAQITKTPQSVAG